MKSIVVKAGSSSLAPAAAKTAQTLNLCPIVMTKGLSFMPRTKANVSGQKQQVYDCPRANIIPATVRPIIFNQLTRRLLIATDPSYGTKGNNY